MTVKQKRSKRKITSGRLHEHRKSRRSEIGRDYVPAHLSDKQKVKKIRTTGGNKKFVAIEVRYANIFVNDKAQKVEIKNVIENKANPHLVRRNIITKGAIIETDLGKAIVTSRPGQDGIVNAKILN